MRNQVMIKRALSSAGIPIRYIKEDKLKRRLPVIINKVTADHPYWLTKDQKDINPVLIISLSNLASLLEKLIESRHNDA